MSAAAVRITAMVVAWIPMIRSAQALDGIVIVLRVAAVVPATGAVKLRTQILRGAGNFRTALHAYAAGKTGGDHYGLTTTGYGLKFHYAFIHVNFSKAATVNFNVKLGSADRDNRAGRSDLKCRRSAHTLLNLRADVAHEQLKIFPAAGLRLFQQELGMRAHQHIASIRELQQQAAIVRAYRGLRWQNFATDRSRKRLRGKLYADFSLEIGNCCPGIRSAGGSCRRRFLSSCRRAIQHKADEREN